MAKENLSRKGLKNKKSLIIIILLLINTLIILMYSFSLSKEIYYKEYYKGKFMSINEASNLIDLIPDKNENILLSPYNFYTSINLIYSGTDNNSYKQIRTYTTYNHINYNDLITNMTNNNTISNKIKNEYYEELIKEFYSNKYNELNIDKIKKLNEKEEENLLLLLLKINTSYDSIKGLNNYEKDYIKELKLTSKDRNKSTYDIKGIIDKVLNDYESYNYNEEIININKLYLNSNFYDIKNLKENYKTLSLLNFDTDETKVTINNELNRISNNNIKYYIDEHILNGNDNIYINTLIFNMEWDSNINIKNNSSIEFTLPDKNIKMVEAMTENIYSYLDNGYAKGFKKNFSNNKYSFIAILPNDPEDYSLSHLNIETLIKSEKTKEPILVTMPIFSYQSEIDLNKLYNSIGIKDITTNKANFHNLMETSFNLDYSIQKNRITISNKGTYNTNVISQQIESFARDENQKTLIFNRSFSYIIINNETNEVLLIGKVYNP